MYLISIFLPAAISSVLTTPISLYQEFPLEEVRRAVFACSLFLLGLGLGAIVFPFTGLARPTVESDSFRSGLIGLVGIVTVVSAYVFVAGPPAPFFEAFSLTDPDAIMLA